MKTIIDRSECNPLSDNIEGKLVVIKPDFFKPEFRDAKYQIVLATGGFGCDASKIGNAVYVEEVHTDNHGALLEMSYVLIEVFGLTDKQVQEIERNDGLTNADLEV
jgi:hypothetical protein